MTLAGVSYAVKRGENAAKEGGGVWMSDSQLTVPCYTELLYYFQRLYRNILKLLNSFFNGGDAYVLFILYN